MVQLAGIPDAWPDGNGVYGGGGAWALGRVMDMDVCEALGLDQGMQRVSVNNYLCPKFEETVLEQYRDWSLLRDENGMIVKRLHDRQSLPHFVRGPVETREDWERLKAERLRPTLEGRLHANWKEIVDGYRRRTFPLAIGGSQGFYGTPRWLFGEVQVMIAYYDCPGLMHDIVNDLADFWIELYDLVLNETDVDLALLWEDMAYKNGPLISPVVFEEFMLPAYKKITGFFRDRGIRVILVDSDGNIWKLLPLFIKGGVTGVYPFEVMAGMNVVEVRRAYPKLQILGGIDKTALAKEPGAIKTALDDVQWMLSERGYIPYIDHFIPPDVSWERFVTYRKKLNELIDCAPK